MVALLPALTDEKKRGLFAGKKALEQENAELRAAFEAIGAVERERLRREVAVLGETRSKAQAEVDGLEAYARVQREKEHIT